MKGITFRFFKLIPAMVFILLSYLSFGQNQLDGLWKSTYVTSYSAIDTGIQYTRIFLDIKDSVVTLKNFDGIFKEKEIFSNSGVIDQEQNILIFHQNTDNEKIYPVTIEDNYLKFNLSESPKEEITLKKLIPYNLANKKANLNEKLIKNFISGDFSYYNESLGIEFKADSSMLVTSSLKSYLSILDKWAMLDFGNELFLYLSDFGPMVHITNFTEDQFDFSDEYDSIYNGSFRVAETEVKFNIELLFGLWEQEKPDTTGISSIPQVMFDKDYYVNEIWEFTEKQAIKYHQFFIRKSPWETSRNNEIILLESMDDRKFRVLFLDDHKLVVERVNMYGDVYEDTFKRRKPDPKPTTLGKYLK